MANTTYDEAVQIYQEHSYTNSYIHPVTGTAQKFVVGDRFHDSGNLDIKKNLQVSQYQFMSRDETISVHYI